LINNVDSRGNGSSEMPGDYISIFRGAITIPKSVFIRLNRLKKSALRFRRSRKHAILYVSILFFHGIEGRPGYEKGPSGYQKIPA
jgi:hypothetical protein